MVLSFSYLILGVGLCHPCGSLPALDILWFYDLRSVSGDTLELDMSVRLAAHLFLPCKETQTNEGSLVCTIWVFGASVEIIKVFIICVD